MKLTSDQIDGPRSLDALMGAVLARLELASSTSASSTDSGKVTHGKPGGNEPPPVASSFDHYERRYFHCRTDDQRRTVIREAMNELRSIRYAKKGGHRETREGRLTIGRDPRPVAIVAYVYGYTERHVWRLRAEAKQHDARVPRRHESGRFAA